MGVLEHGALLGIEAQRVALIEQRLDAREQRRIQIDRVAVFGVLRRQRFLGSLQGLVGVGAGEHEEHVGAAREQFAAALHGLDGVLEGRRLGVVGDGANFGQVLLHALFDGRLVVGVFQLVEGRRLERQRAGRHQRILGRRGGGGLGSGHRGLGGCAVAAGDEGQRDRGRQEQRTQHGWQLRKRQRGDGVGRVVRPASRAACACRGSGGIGRWLAAPECPGSAKSGVRCRRSGCRRTLPGRGPGPHRHRLRAGAAAAPRRPRDHGPAGSGP